MNTPSSLYRLVTFALAVSPVGFSLLRAADVAPVPAPVPAAVAIARPSAAELQTASASLQRLLSQADPAMKAFVAKHPDLIGIRPPPDRVNPAIVPLLQPNFRAKHAANVEIAKKGDIDILFMGDSITDFWRVAKEGPNPASAGKAVFDKYYGAMKVANFGISGDFTQGVLYRLRDGEGQGFQPKVVELMIGTNNAATCTAAEIAEGVGAIVMELRKDFPAAKILLLAIFPRGSPGDPVRKTVADVNPIIAKLHDGKNVFYLDIGAKFLDEQGNIPADIMPDKLHPTEKGYAIWAEAVKAPLADLLK